MIETLIHHPTRQDLFNWWGTRKTDLDPKEYCQECEQDTRVGHYGICPTLTKP